MQSADAKQGYLRCAKVLQLMGKRELALKIYERGLTKVKIGTDDNRAVRVYSKIYRIVPRFSFMVFATILIP